MADVAGDADESLVAAAAAGDRPAFETLLRRHYDRVHGLAWQLTGSRADADDIAQEVCCTLVEKIGSFRGEAKFTTWLTGITFNACRDFRRRRRSLGGMLERLSVIAGIATFLFAEIARGPFPLALGLDGAELDLSPVVGSTIRGLIV